MKLFSQEGKVLELGGNKVQGCTEQCQEGRGESSCKDREEQGVKALRQGREGLKVKLVK